MHIHQGTPLHSLLGFLSHCGLFLAWWVESVHPSWSPVYKKKSKKAYIDDGGWEEVCSKMCLTFPQNPCMQGKGHNCLVHFDVLESFESVLRVVFSLYKLVTVPSSRIEGKCEKRNKTPPKVPDREAKSAVCVWSKRLRWTLFPFPTLRYLEHICIHYFKYGWVIILYTGCDSQITPLYPLTSPSHPSPQLCPLFCTNTGEGKEI